ncbi:MAG: hypothetical protein L0154_01590 [Chloroflexi bacterium]|nr:hypothetical protein [Chloroflexota bacterium]
MSKHWILLIIIMILPVLACNLASDEPTVVPTQVSIGVSLTQTAQSQPIVVTATQSTQQSATVRPTSTQFQSSGTSVSPGSVTGSPVFSGLSFGASAGGPNQTTFPNGTEEVYVRWNYSNVPIGTTMRRVWYKDGAVVVSREEDWSTNWGTSGRLTHIKLFDYDVGLDSGNYYVVISLPVYNVSIDGNFSITGSTSGTASFSNISTATSRDGQTVSVMPYGTQEVFVRWDYANIPAGSTMQRDWYHNGTNIVSRSEAWSTNWGTTGRLTHISLYDFTSGFGLQPGNYRVVIYLTNQPSVKVETTFTIQSNVGPIFSNLRMKTSPDGLNQTAFPAGTTRVYAVWDYSNIPVGAQVHRIWRRNEQIFADRTEAWDFNKYGTSGTVTDVYIFDEISGLSSGNYLVEISLVGQPGVSVTQSFTIGS